MMLAKNYRLYDIADFVIDEDFIRWIQDKAEHDNQFWESWFNENPDKHLIVTEAGRIVELMPFNKKQFSNKEIKFDINRLLQTIQQTPDEQNPHRRELRGLYKGWYAAALIFIIIAGSIFLFTRNKESLHVFSYASYNAKEHIEEEKNTMGKTLELPLTGARILEISPGSRIGYPANFDSAATRNIYPLGEVFFNVAKNLHRTTTPDGIMVAPNQQLVYERAEQK